MPDTPFASSRNWRGPLLNAEGQPDELPDNDSDHDELASKLALKVSAMLDAQHAVKVWNRCSKKHPQRSAWPLWSCCSGPLG